MGGCASSAVDQSDLNKVENMKKASRRQGFSAEPVSQERLKNWKRPYSPKSEETSRRIESLIRSNKQLQVLFGSMMDDSEALRQLIGAMFVKSTSPGEVIIKQSDAGDAFYIVDEGTFEILVQRGDKPPAKVLECGPGSSFGELALMWNAPRAATVIATSPGRCWCLDRDSFQMMVVSSEVSKHQEIQSFLSKVPILQELNRYEISRLAEMIKFEDMAPSHAIVNQGELGHTFYILASGDCTAFIDGEAGRFAVKSYTVPGDYFGEVALISSEPRKASVIAGPEGCKLYVVGKEDFDRVLGPITDRLKAKADQYPAYSAFLVGLEAR